MKFKIILYHLNEYLFSLPATIFHELCHWIIAMIFYCVGLINSVPKIRITEWHLIEEEGSYVSTKSMSACVYYSTTLSPKLDILVNGIVAIAPAFGVITLMLFCPWYINILLFNRITTLWLSIGDIERVNKMLKVNKKVLLNH